MTDAPHSLGDLQSRMLERMEIGPHAAWTPGDFADLGNRAAVEKTLQRFAIAGIFGASTEVFMTFRPGIASRAARLSRIIGEAIQADQVR